MNHPDTQLLTALRSLAADIATTHQPPRAATLWLRAQLRDRYRSRQTAIQRATLPLRLMSALGLLVAVCVSTFALHHAGPTYIRNLATAHTSLFALALPATALIFVGACILLRIGNRETTT